MNTRKEVSRRTLILGKRRFSIGSPRTKPLIFVAVSVLAAVACLSQPCPGQVNEADKENVIRQVATYWIEVGSRQYERGLYSHAEKSLNNALEYEQYLTTAELDRLNRLSQWIKLHASKREQIVEHLEAANKLIDENQMAEAKTHLESIRNNEFLTDGERAQVNRGLARIEEILNERKKRITELYERGKQFYSSLSDAKQQLMILGNNEFLTADERSRIEDSLQRIDFRVSEEQRRVTELYGRGVDYYRQGQFQKAEKCYTEMQKILTGDVEVGSPTEPEPAEVVIEEIVAEPAEGEDASAIEKELLGVMNQAAEPETTAPESDISDILDAPELFVVNVAEEPNRPAGVEVVEPPAVEPVVESVPGKIQVLRSYIAAVVEDASLKVEDHAMRGEFDQARKVVQSAEQTVNDNQVYLSEELFIEHISRLRQLTQKIVELDNAGTR